MTTTPSTSRLTTSQNLDRLRLTTSVLGALAVVQLGLGIYVAFHHHVKGTPNPVREVHGWIGYVATMVAIVVALFAYLWSKDSGARGTFFHALSLPVLCVLQIGLAEARLKWVHVVLGVVYMIAVAGLFAMTRKPVRPVSTTAEGQVTR